MLEQGYRKDMAAGTVCAVGTLGILIPPSIMLVLMADRLAMARERGQVYKDRYNAAIEED